MPRTRNALDDVPEPERAMSVRTLLYELNQSLAIMVGCAELLARHSDLAPPLRELAVEALAASEATAETVRKIHRALLG